MKKLEIKVLRSRITLLSCFYILLMSSCANAANLTKDSTKDMTKAIEALTIRGKEIQKKKDEYSKELEDNQKKQIAEIEKMGETFYAALKENNIQFIRKVIKSTDFDDYRTHLVGYALYTAALEEKNNSIDGILKNLVEQTDSKGQDTQDQDLMLNWVSRAIYESIAKNDDKLLLFWKQKVNQLYSTHSNYKYYSLKDILGVLLDFIVEAAKNSDADSDSYFRLLIDHVDLSHALLNSFNAKLLTLVGSPSNNKQLQSLEKSIQNYQSSKYQLSRAKPVPSIRPSYNFTIPPNREKDVYSSSEEEDAPHFNGIYNLTKHGIMDITNPETGYNPMKSLTGHVVNNYVTDHKEINLDSLIEDAKEIHPNSSDQNSTITILCAALRQKDGRIKKFVFTNQPSVYQDDQTKEILENRCVNAHEKGYHVIMAQQAHAEGELIQFLEERRTRYTHIVGIGASRPHCSICDIMLKDYMGSDYGTITHSGQDTLGIVKNNDWFMPRALKEALRLYQIDTKKAITKNASWEKDQEKLHQSLDPQEWKERKWKSKKSDTKKATKYTSKISEIKKQ